MRLIARFAKEQKNYFEIITVYDLRIVKERLNKERPTLVSIVKDYPAAVWFERKMSDDFGIEILYANDKRPLLAHTLLSPLRKTPINSNGRVAKQTDNLFNLNLHLTHSYHLESSQFRFLEKNSSIKEFEVTSFYKHRGIEKMLEGLIFEDARPIIERISGSMSIAYQMAYLDIGLQASNKELPTVIKKRHIFFLEFERILNHLYDMSVMCQFAEFKEGSSFLMKLLEEGREVLKKLTGHRFGFSAIRIDDSIISIEESYNYLFYLERELRWFEKWIKAKTSFWKKLCYEGALFKKDIQDYGVVGIMARSVDIALDRREDDPLYMENNFHMAIEYTGDNSARFKIRLTEIYTSFRLIRPLLKNRVLPFFLGKVTDGEYYSYIESSTGELMMYMAIEDGRIERFFLRDPTFLNAQILPYAMKDSRVSSLGVIAKSIPLNFSASDL